MKLTRKDLILLAIEAIEMRIGCGDPSDTEHVAECDAMIKECRRQLKKPRPKRKK